MDFGRNFGRLSECRVSVRCFESTLRLALVTEGVECVSDRVVQVADVVTIVG